MSVIIRISPDQWWIKRMACRRAFSRSIEILLRKISDFKLMYDKNCTPPPSSGDAKFPPWEKHLNSTLIQIKSFLAFLKLYRTFRRQHRNHFEFVLTFFDFSTFFSNYNADQNSILLLLLSLLQIFAIIE